MAELVEALSFFFTGGMPFWAYMLHCADRSFYVGHTDDLEKRTGEHVLGLVPGYTQSRLPVKLVWSEEFPTRMEAREAERQIKGWRRAKKLALVRGDWALISRLAKGRKEGPSTSSGKPVSVLLHPHPAHLPSEPFSLEAVVRRAGERLHIRYRLTGPVSMLYVPPLSPPARRDGLWQHTCFEAFIRCGQDAGYHEANLAPSGEWAIYSFDSYRAGMMAPGVEQPEIHVRCDRHKLELTAALAIGMADQAITLNLSAVIEGKDGSKSYWALRHPLEGSPDFHHPDCFALTLPAPGGA